jgi:hypothetical protein
MVIPPVNCWSSPRSLDTIWTMSPELTMWGSVVVTVMVVPLPTMLTAGVPKR